MRGSASHDSTPASRYTPRARPGMEREGAGGLQTPAAIMAADLRDRAALADLPPDPNCLAADTATPSVLESLVEIVRWTRIDSPADRTNLSSRHTLLRGRSKRFKSLGEERLFHRGLLCSSRELPLQHSCQLILVLPPGCIIHDRRRMGVRRQRLQEHPRQQDGSCRIQNKRGSAEQNKDGYHS